MMLSNSPAAQRKKWLIILVLFLLCVLMYILFSNMSLPPNLELGTSKWLPYRAQAFRDKVRNKFLLAGLLMKNSGAIVVVPSL